MPLSARLLCTGVIICCGNLKKTWIREGIGPPPFLCVFVLEEPKSVAVIKKAPHPMWEGDGAKLGNIFGRRLERRIHASGSTLSRKARTRYSMFSKVTNEEVWSEDMEDTSVDEEALLPSRYSPSRPSDRLERLACGDQEQGNVERWTGSKEVGRRTW